MRKNMFLLLIKFVKNVENILKSILATKSVQFSSSIFNDKLSIKTTKVGQLIRYTVEFGQKREKRDSVDFSIYFAISLDFIFLSFSSLLNIRKNRNEFNLIAA